MKAKQTRTKNTRKTARTHLKHALVPHKGNHYRPHLVRLQGITAILLLVIAVQLTYSFATTGRLEVLGRISNISVDALVADTNERRATSSLPNLQVDTELTAAAFAKAQDMFEHNYWAHVSPEGVTPWRWIGEAGYNYNVAGENLAKNYPTASATVDAWMASPTHRANILNGKYQDVGFAVVDGELDGRDATIIVAYYGAPATTAAVEGATDTRTSQDVYAAPVENGVGNPLTYFGTAIQSMSPATLGSLALLALVASVAVAAHHYRKKMPLAWRRSWKQHHGMYTFAGTVGLALVIVIATGGGQI